MTKAHSLTLTCLCWHGCPHCFSRLLRDVFCHFNLFRRRFFHARCIRQFLDPDRSLSIFRVNFLKEQVAGSLPDRQTPQASFVEVQTKQFVPHDFVNNRGFIGISSELCRRPKFFKFVCLHHNFDELSLNETHINALHKASKHPYHLFFGFERSSNGVAYLLRLCQ